MPTEPDPAWLAEKDAAKDAAGVAAEGVRLHRAGERDAASEQYRRALAIYPGDATALHGLGVVALEEGRSATAIAFLGRATAAAPDRAEPFLHLGLALREQDHAEPARAALHVAALRDPSDPRAPAAMAAVLEAMGRFAEAAVAARTAIRLDPASGQAGTRAPGAQAVLGRCLAREFRFADALPALRAALAEAPGDLLSAQELGRCALATGDAGAAEAAFRSVLGGRPDDPAAQANLGAALFELNRHEEAEAVLRRAAGAPDPSGATLSNLGLVLMARGALAEAADRLGRAATLAPGDAGISTNLGTVLLDLGRFEEAEARFMAVEARSAAGPDAMRARFNRGTALLATGRYRDGWRLWEARRLLPGVAEDPSGLPAWDGIEQDEPVLLFPEQGLGDTIQFLRFVPLVCERAPAVLRLPESLHALVQPLLGPRCRLLRREADRAACSAAAGLLSLPFLLGLGGPDGVGAYLSGPERVLPGGARRVGVHWAGSPSYRFDRRRSVALGVLAPLREVPGVHLVSLQQGEAAEQSGLSFAERLAPGASLQDTAALIAGLDAVVAVDSAIAHLAGALGRPVWLLDRFGGDWRWRPANRTADGRSRWYPTVVPVTQPEVGNWDAPVARIVEALGAGG